MTASKRAVDFIELESYELDVDPTVQVDTKELIAGLDGLWHGAPVV